MPKNIINVLFIFLSTFLLANCANTPNFFDAQLGQQITTSRASLNEDAFWNGSTSTIWDRLQHQPVKTLEPALSTTPDPTRNAWLKLAIISKRYNNNTPQLIQQLLTWRNEHSNHPGNALFPSNSTLQSLLNHNLPSHYALLLPLQGPMHASGQAVRDGFLNAYYAQAKYHAPQTISFYDTSNQPVAAAYQKAVADGATIVIGPLTKNEVQNLENYGNFTVPVLALNYTDSWSLPSHFYEFGLSPADESQQVADKAWQAGLSRAIIIAPQTPWGQRVASTLISRWKALGGTVSDTFYFSSETDFTQAIASLMHIDTKEDRKKMRKDNNKTTLEKQRRQDFDVIFLLAEPKNARTIVPLLRYYYADHIPIYSTSMIYSGVPNPTRDSDLNGITFSDIPWVLNGKNTSPSNSSRLYAVGHDAYLISSELSRLTTLPNFPVYASTGALNLTSKQKIYRRLPWATMHEGHP